MTAKAKKTISHLPPKRKAPASPLDTAKAHEVIWQEVCRIFKIAVGIENVTFVYLIGEVDDGPVKIGLAKDPIARLRGMQIGNSRRFRVERVLVGDLATEKLLHRFWQPYAIKTPTNSGTEWFQPEIREELYPIVETAADHQVMYLAAPHDETSFGFQQLRQIIRDAHKDHDFVLQARTP